MEKLFTPKFDYLCKHVGSKIIIPPGSMLLKVHYEDCQHVKNEMFYVSRSGENVLDNVMQGVAHEGLKTFI